MPFVTVRGGGDLATGTIHRLWKCGFSVLVLETGHPSAIRRCVAFSEAVYEGTWTVEGVSARRISRLSQAEECFKTGVIPVLVDPAGDSIRERRPDVLVDAVLAKRNLGTRMDMADLVIALGPGFTAGVDAHAVIETMRGHDLGRIIEAGTAAPDTGVPGMIQGFGKERVIHAPAAGKLRGLCRIGDIVQKGQVIAVIGRVPVKAALTGVLRGLIRDGYPVTEGFKIADIDPRLDEQKNCFTISDKARCIAGSVLEAILAGQRKKTESQKNSLPEERAVFGRR